MNIVKFVSSSLFFPLFLNQCGCVCVVSSIHSAYIKTDKTEVLTLLYNTEQSATSMWTSHHKHLLVRTKPQMKGLEVKCRIYFCCAMPDMQLYPSNCQHTKQFWNSLWPVFVLRKTTSNCPSQQISLHVLQTQLETCFMWAILHQFNQSTVK